MALLSGTRQRSGALFPAEEPLGDEMQQQEEKEVHPVIALINRVGKRNWIIVGAVALIGLAVALNWHFFATEGTKDTYASYDQAAGMLGQGDTATGSGESESTEDYFATAELNRRRARDESLEVLQSVLDSELADESVKAQAMEEMAAIAAEIDKEANIESLLISKGFANCIAILGGESINVVVRSEGELQPAQIAQINAVVFEQTGIAPQGVIINHHQ